eukprot:gene17922-biopygen5181
MCLHILCFLEEERNGDDQSSIQCPVSDELMSRGAGIEAADPSRFAWDRRDVRKTNGEGHLKVLNGWGCGCIRRNAATWGGVAASGI